MRARCFTMALLVALMGFARGASAEILVQSRLWEGDIRFVQPVDGGAQGYLLVVGDRMVVMDGPQRDWRLQEGFLLPMDPVGGAAWADFTGAGYRNLAVGGGGAGAVYIYRRSTGGWTLVGRTNYIWTPVAGLLTGEVTGPGRHDLLVAGEDGRIHLFSWSFGEFQHRWESPGEGRWSAALADLTGDGRVEVILWRQEGYVGVWRWAGGGLVPVWENYPWGAVAGLTVGDVDGDGLPDIVLTTSQHLLYAFGWQDGEFRLKRHLSHPLLPLPQLAAAWHGGEAHLLASDGSRLYWFRVGQNDLVRRWVSGPLGDVRALFPVPGRRGFLVWHPQGLGLLEPAPPDTLRLSWQGGERDLRYRPLVEDGKVWLSARDVADALGWDVRWDPERQRFSMGGWGGFFMGQVGRERVLTGHGVFHLDDPLRIEDGRVYLPLGALAALGFSVRWEELPRRLSVE